VDKVKATKTTQGETIMNSETNEKNYMKPSPIAIAVKMVANGVKFSRSTMTIAEYLRNLAPITDCNPISQRPAVHVEPNNAKAKAIITSVLNNIDIGNITLVDVTQEESVWQWESLDGGHRKRDIRDFIQGKITVGNDLSYSQLSEEQREAFMNYEMAFTLYTPMSNFMKGHIFRSLNETTDVNDQETLNSYGDHPIANAVRETVRVVSLRNGKTSVIHDLFEVTTGGNFKWLAGANPNGRLRLEEFVARVYYSFYNKGALGSRKYNNLERMYNDDKLNVAKLRKQADKFFDFLYEMAKVRKQTAGNGLGNSERVTLLNLYLYLSESYGSDLESTDYLEWYKAFSKVYNDLYNDPRSQWRLVPDAKLMSTIGESKESTITQLFQDYTRNHDSAEKQKQMVRWLTEHPEWINVTDHTLFKDRNRSFPNWMKEVVLQEQGYVCVIDGLELNWSDAEAGHIIAHAKGGKTVLDNCAMIRKSHNRDMGTMDVNDYKNHYNMDLAV
jgi:hypothetical protein